jgi:MoxR-like ATPase
VERELLVARDRAEVLLETEPDIFPADILELQSECRKIHASDALLDYIQALLAATRNSRWFEIGLSPRAGIALLRSSQSYAFLEGRSFIVPEDIKAVFPALARHRMTVPHGMEESVEEQIDDLLQQVAIP